MSRAPKIRKVILGAIEGYRFEQIALFFSSLKASGYDGDIVLFHRGIDPQTLDALRGFGVQLLPIARRGVRNPVTRTVYNTDGRLGHLLSPARALLTKLPAGGPLKEAMCAHFAARFFHIANARFVLACHWLKARKDRYDCVMISDIRDVAFQSDPFALEDASELCLFLEDPKLTLRTCENYRDWIEAAFGRKEAGELLDRRLSCCAVTLGPAGKMLRYLELMSGLMFLNSTCEPYRFGLDSAIHNHLLWRERLPSPRVFENFEGPVLHMGGLSRPVLPANPQGMLLNRDGSAITILHQYDRHPDIHAELARRFP